MNSRKRLIDSRNCFFCFYKIVLCDKIALIERDYFYTYVEISKGSIFCDKSYECGAQNKILKVVVNTGYCIFVKSILDYV